MLDDSVPAIVVNRLPIYLRMLAFLEREGKMITSSQELAERLGFSSAQIRKDLSYFGEFGKQGMGYNVAYLQKQLREILKINRVWDVVLIGAGNLGRALANYEGFEDHGFRVIGLFDNAPKKVGTQVGQFVVQDMAELPKFVRDRHLEIAMLAVPAEDAQRVANHLIELGIRGILNYAPITLNVPENIHVYYIDPVVGLQSMTYYL